MNIKTTEERHSFRADYRAAWLSALGLLGFVVGCLILFGGDIFDGRLDKGTVFHEILYNPRAIADILLKKPIDFLRIVTKERQLRIGLNDQSTKTEVVAGNRDADKQMAEKEAEINTRKGGAKAEKSGIDTFNRLKQEQEIDIAILNKLTTYSIITENLSEADVSKFDKLNHALHFNISPATLRSWQKGADTLRSKWAEEVQVSFKEIAVPFTVSGQIKFTVQPPGSDMAFMTKYPAIGSWLLLVLIFISFCFIAVSTSIAIARRLSGLLKENKIKDINFWTYWVWVVVVTLVLFLLAGLWRLTFYDEEAIKNLLFMHSQSDAMRWTTFIGYIAGAFCLAGFIYTAGSLGFIRENLSSLRQLPADTNGVTEEKKRQESIYLNLFKYFNTYFILSSVILSVMVLYTGGLYAAVNSLDFVRLLANDWGYSPARNEFVYLYGSLHTVIVLLFYIPTKMQFSEIAVDDNTSTTNGNRKSPDVIKNLLGSLKDMLLTVSPLLASVGNSLIDALFQ